MSARQAAQRRSGKTVESLQALLRSPGSVVSAAVSVPAPQIKEQSKEQLILRLASHPDQEFQTPQSLPLDRSHLFCWTTYFQGYLKCHCEWVRTAICAV